MSTTTTTEPVVASGTGLRPRSIERPRLTFGTILAAEWTKVVTVRSTVLAAAALVILAVGMSGLVAAFSEPAGAAGTARLVGNTLVSGVSFSQLVMGVLAVLLVSSEYATGMIQSTLVAVPRRLSLLAAKTVVAVVTAIVVTVVAWLLSAALVLPIFSGQGVHASLLDRDVVSGLAAFVTYMVIVALFGVFVATIVRNSAGSIAIVVGVLFVLPIAGSLLPGIVQLNDYLLAGAAQTISSAFLDPTVPVGDVTRAIVVVIVWLVALGTAAALLLRRRDA